MIAKLIELHIAQTVEEAIELIAYSKECGISLELYL